MENIWIGIISGLLVVILIFIYNQVLIKIILPWYENLVYKDIVISGEWRSSNNEEYSNEKIIIEQSAHTIKGSIIAIDGDDKGSQYIFDGIFSNLILTATYKPINQNKSLDRGSFTLKIIEDGNKLKGYASIYDNETDSIKQHEYIFIKHEN